MTGKTLIYLVLEIRSVFLCAKNSARFFYSNYQKKLQISIKTVLMFIVLFAAVNFQGISQTGPNCPAGQRVCKDGTCRPARQCGQGVPPPPGLPLDSKIPFLIIAGLGLGIYYVRSRKTV